MIRSNVKWRNWLDEMIYSPTTYEQTTYTPGYFPTRRCIPEREKSHILLVCLVLVSAAIRALLVHSTESNHPSFLRTIQFSGAPFTKMLHLSESQFTYLLFAVETLAVFTFPSKRSSITEMVAPSSSPCAHPFGIVSDCGTQKRVRQCVRKKKQICDKTSWAYAECIWGFAEYFSPDSEMGTEGDWSN